MSEYMGLIHGNYDAKQSGFIPGSSSLHNCMTAHGPDATAFNAASAATLQPEYYQDTLAFMFESCHRWQPTEFALKTPLRQKEYQQCWQTLPKLFKLP
jgi:homogentisate 1,2-dioxygenase